MDEKWCPSCKRTLPAWSFTIWIGESKESAISDALGRGWSIERIQEKMQKCVVLCANCHRKLHYSERQ
jgi:hypothetical protein